MDAHLLLELPPCNDCRVPRRSEFAYICTAYNHSSLCRRDFAIASPSASVTELRRSRQRRLVLSHDEHRSADEELDRNH